MPGVFLSPGGRYRPDIDGLRAVAVSAVLGFHYFPRYFPGGFAGVDIFFVISGFLIAGIILDDLAENKFSFPAFYARRIRRLFPALALVLAATLAAGWLVLFPGEFKALGKHTAGGAGFISNILYWRESGYFDAEAATKPLLHLWSLGIEEQFYLAFPFLLWWAGKKGFREISLIILVLAASLAYNLHIRYTSHAADFYSPLARFWELLAGAVLAGLSRVPAASPRRRAALKIDGFLAGLLYKKPGPNRGVTLNHTLSVLGLIMVLLAVFTFRERPTWPGHWVITPVVGAALILAAGPGGWLNRQLLSNRLAVAVGLISYPLYLWHWPILVYMRILNGGMPARHERILGALLSLALAGLTYKFLERPVRFGTRLKALKTFLMAALLALAAGAGLFIYARAGLPERSFIKPWQKKIEALAPAAFKDESIAQYAPETRDLRGYKHYLDAGSSRTVAVIGDSHARAAFPGIAEKNHDLGLNSVLLMYRPDDSMTTQERELTLTILKSKKDISDVFVIMRGMLYLTGNDLDGYKDWEGGQGDKFKPFLQKLVDELRAAGKTVYIVSENPVFSYQPRDFIGRPFSRKKSKPPILAREDVYRHQKGYLDMLSAIRGAEIINGIDFLCPDNACSMFSKDGLPLYSDDDHLSIYGGRYMVEKLLEPYLARISLLSEI